MSKRQKDKKKFIILEEAVIDGLMESAGINDLKTEQPREFWINPIAIDKPLYATYHLGDVAPHKDSIHVREVIEAPEWDINAAAAISPFCKTDGEIEAFEAGARWASAKLRGVE